MELKENTSYLFTSKRSERELERRALGDKISVLEGYVGYRLEQLNQINIFKITENAIEYSSDKSKQTTWITKIDFEHLYLYYDTIGECPITPYGQPEICSKPCNNY